MSNSPVITCHKPAPAELNCKPDLTCFEQGCWQEHGNRRLHRSVGKLSGIRGHWISEDCRRAHGGCRVLGKHRAEPVLVALNWQCKRTGASSAEAQALGRFPLLVFRPSRATEKQKWSKAWFHFCPGNICSLCSACTWDVG